MEDSAVAEDGAAKGAQVSLESRFAASVAFSSQGEAGELGAGMKRAGITTAGLEDWVWRWVAEEHAVGRTATESLQAAMV